MQPAVEDRAVLVARQSLELALAQLVALARAGQLDRAEQREYIELLGLAQRRLRAAAVLPVVETKRHPAER